MKKIVEWLLVAVMCLGVSVPAFAGVSESFETDLESIIKDAPFFDTFTWKTGRIWSFPHPVKVFLVDSEHFIFVSDKPCDYTMQNNSGVVTYGSFLSSNNLYYSYQTLWDYPSVQQDIIHYSNISFTDVTYFFSVYTGDLGGSGGSVPSSDYVYDSTIPAPRNVRFVKDGKYGTIKWDNTMEDDKYGVLITSDFYYWSTFPFVGSSGYFLNEQLVTHKDFIKANVSNYALSSEYMDALFERVKEELSFYEKPFYAYARITRADVQFYYIDDDGVLHYGDYSKCIINWKSDEEFSCTSSVYKGSVESDDQTGSLGNGSGTHISDSGVSHGGGGVSMDGYNHYDQEGNMVESDSVDPTLNGFLETLINIPNVINRFFQAIASMIASMQQLPALIGQLFVAMPADNQVLMTFGVMTAIILRAFSR